MHHCGSRNTQEQQLASIGVDRTDIATGGGGTAGRAGGENPVTERGQLGEGTDHTGSRNKAAAIWIKLLAHRIKL